MTRISALVALALMAGLMRANHAPPEAFARLDITPEGAPTGVTA